MGRLRPQRSAYEAPFGRSLMAKLLEGSISCTAGYSTCQRKRRIEQPRQLRDVVSSFDAVSR
jgi:hypothetical protein